MLSRILGFPFLIKDKPHYPSLPASTCMLPENVLMDVFIHLPPDPACLLRASFVCKHWRSLIIDHRFLSRFQAFHGTPMLGIFTNSTSIPRFLPIGDPPDHVTAAAFSMPDLHWHVLGCRHSCVLLVGSSWKQLQVWNPVNSNKHFIPSPPDVDPCFNSGHVPESNAAVLCAAGHTHHGYSHSCPFLIIWVFTSARYAYATRYSSDNSDWLMMASSPIPSDIDSRPSILVRDVLYWPLKSKYILAFELGTHRLYHIECPPETHDVYRRNVRIMKTEDGGLGLAVITKFNLRLWAWETDAEGDTGWVLRNIVELDKFLPLEVSSLPFLNNCLSGKPPVRILDLVEDDDLVFTWTIIGVFAVQLKSMQFKKVFEADVCASVFPYKAFSIAGAYISMILTGSYPRKMEFMSVFRNELSSTGFI
uniref:F-box domain-containing protein n=2 Tax=Arundo donax TaxID=35708 RepID=A0A0A9ETC8_ARUDO